MASLHSKVRVLSSFRFPLNQAVEQVDGPLDVDDNGKYYIQFSDCQAKIKMPTIAEAAAFEGNECMQCGNTGVPLLACDDPDVLKAHPSTPRPRFCNNCMIGKKVRVFWPVDSTWYTGTVDSYDEKTGEHLLIYPDGDQEWVKIGESSPNSGSPQRGHLEAMPTMPTTEHPSLATDIGAYGFAGYPYAPPPYGVFNYSQMPFTQGASPPTGDGKADSPSDEAASMRKKSGPKAWTKEEDAMLLNIVKNMQMPMKWSIVAQSLPERTGKQCRERYVNHLNPRLKVSDWNALEDAMVFHLYNSMGSHWAKMSKIIPGRTDNGIKNRFHNLRRQFEREDEHRLRLSTTEELQDSVRLDRLRKFPEAMLGRTSKLWDIHSGIAILASQSIVGGTNILGRSKSKFGPFRKAKDGDICVRCGLVLPSVQTSDEICEKSGWCMSCSRIPAHLSSNLLRECVNLRREQREDLRGIIESWEEFFAKQEGDSVAIQKAESDKKTSTNSG